MKIFLFFKNSTLFVDVVSFSLVCVLAVYGSTCLKLGSNWLHLSRMLKKRMLAESSAKCVLLALSVCSSWTATPCTVNMYFVVL